MEGDYRPELGVRSHAIFGRGQISSPWKPSGRRSASSSRLVHPGTASPPSPRDSHSTDGLRVSVRRLESYGAPYPDDGASRPPHGLGHGAGTYVGHSWPRHRQSPRHDRLHASVRDVPQLRDRSAKPTRRDSHNRLHHLPTVTGWIRNIRATCRLVRPSAAYRIIVARNVRRWGLLGWRPRSSDFWHSYDSTPNRSFRRPVRIVFPELYRRDTPRPLDIQRLRSPFYDCTIPNEWRILAVSRR
jgi:hypothetical protein